MKTHVNDCLLESGRNITEDDFDTSMLYFMLRNGHILDVNENPTRGWGNEPGVYDMSVGDDIERVKLLRNKLCHSSSAAMTERDFNSFIKDAKDILHRHSNETGMALVSDVDEVVNTSLTVAKVNEIREQLIAEIKRTSDEDTHEETVQIQAMVIFLSNSSFSIIGWFVLFFYMACTGCFIKYVTISTLNIV